LRIDAINADIQQTSRELSTMDEMITKNKMNRFNESTPNTFYAGESILLANDSVVEPGDSVLESVNEDKKRKGTNAGLYKPLKNPAAQSNKGTPAKGKDQNGKGKQEGSCNLSCNIF